METVITVETALINVNIGHQLWAWRLQQRELGHKVDACWSLGLCPFVDLM